MDQAERHGVCIKMKNGSGFIILRPDDVDWFVRDLQKAKEAALTLFSEAEG